MGKNAQAVVEEKLRIVVEDLEKAKAYFGKQNKSFETEKAVLVERAEQAEGRLKTITEELSGLKRHIAQMAQAIFGPRIASLQDNSVLMLKDVYTLTEQLYVRSYFAIKAVMGNKEPVKLIIDVMKYLSTFPKQVKEPKRSAARAGATSSLSWAFAYSEELDPAEMAKGFPELKDDGSAFGDADYRRCVKTSRVLATQLVAEMKLKSNQAAYDANNARVRPPSFVSVNLTPPRRKHFFAPDVDPSSILNEEVVFHALSHCNWDMKNLQIEDLKDSLEDDPVAAQTSGQPDVNPSIVETQSSK